MPTPRVLGMLAILSFPDLNLLPKMAKVLKVFKVFKVLMPDRLSTLSILT